MSLCHVQAFSHHLTDEEFKYGCESCFLVVRVLVTKCWCSYQHTLGLLIEAIHSEHIKRIPCHVLLLIISPFSLLYSRAKKSYTERVNPPYENIQYIKWASLKHQCSFFFCEVWVGFLFSLTLIRSIFLLIFSSSHTWYFHRDEENRK